MPPQIRFTSCATIRKPVAGLEEFFLLSIGVNNTPLHTDLHLSLHSNHRKTISMAQFEGGTQGMLLERTEHFDEYGHSLGGRDTEYAYKKPSVLWTDVRGIKDFLPSSTNRSVRSAEFFNRSVRFITLLAIILAIAFRSWWPVLVGGGLFLLILLLSAGLETATRRARAEGAVAGATVATAIAENVTGSRDATSSTNNAANKDAIVTTTTDVQTRKEQGNGALRQNNQQTTVVPPAQPIANGQNGPSQPNATSLANSTTNRTFGGTKNGGTKSLTSANGQPSGMSNGDQSSNSSQSSAARQKRMGNESVADITDNVGYNRNTSEAIADLGPQMKQVPGRDFRVGNKGQQDLISPSYSVARPCSDGSCNAMPCCGVDCNRSLLDSMSAEQLRAANIQRRPTEPFPEPLSPFAQAMMARYKEIAAQEERRRAPCTNVLAKLEKDDPYDPTATIPNPSRHNNWLQVDARYRAEDPLPYKHVRAQAVGYSDDVPSEQLRGSLMNRMLKETDGKGPNGAGNPSTTLIGIDPESASLSQVSSLYRRSSLHDNVDSIYAGANSCRPQQQPVKGPCNVVHDPTERMINDMYEDSTDRVWKQEFLDRRPPPWINPNDSQSRRAEEQAAIDRQSWRGFSMHQGP